MVNEGYTPMRVAEHLAGAITEGLHKVGLKILRFAQDPAKLERLRSMSPDTAEEVDEIIAEIRKIKADPAQMVSLQKEDPEVARLIKNL
jgi:hypothetical protein